MQEKLLEEYRAVREAVGLLDYSSRGKVEVRGPDRVSFLHAMITNDVSGLEEGAGRYGALLTARGRMVSDFFYFRLTESILLDTPSGLGELVLSTLSRYVVMDEVELHDVTGHWGHYSLQGPGAKQLLQPIVSGPLPSKAYRVESVQLGGEEILLIRKDELGERGYELLVRREKGAWLEETLFGAGKPLGLRRVGSEAYDMLRLEAGIPRFGVDMDGKRYPMEARLDEAISLTKGCYIGQEVVAKATHVGGVNNLLTRLRLEEDRVPPAGALVLDEKGDRVGQITSAVYSPRHGSAIAFAYLKRPFAQSGRRFRIELADQELVSSEVVDASAS